MVNISMMRMIRRALTTVQMFFDHNGNLIATRRSTAKATMILGERNSLFPLNLVDQEFYPTMNSLSRIYISHNYRLCRKRWCVE